MDRSLSRTSGNRTPGTVAWSSYQYQDLRKLQWPDFHKQLLHLQALHLVLDQVQGQVLHSLHQGHERGKYEEHQR